MKNIKCNVKFFDGVWLWIPEGSTQPIFRREGDSPIGNAVSTEDLRKNPPFNQIIPCPFCGVLKDFGHDISLHIDPRLGKIV